MRNGIVIDKHDNVVVAIYQLTGGDEVTYTLPDGTEDTLIATQDIPLFHKIARADIAVIAVYPTGAEDCARTLGAVMKKGALVTDVLGIKRYYSQKIAAHLPEYLDYVPAHPMAGREKRGTETDGPFLWKKRPFLYTEG